MGTSSSKVEEAILGKTYQTSNTLYLYPYVSDDPETTIRWKMSPVHIDPISQLRGKVVSIGSVLRVVRVNRKEYDPDTEEYAYEVIVNYFDTEVLCLVDNARTSANALAMYLFYFAGETIVAEPIYLHRV